MPENTQNPNPPIQPQNGVPLSSNETKPLTPIQPNQVPSAAKQNPVQNTNTNTVPTPQTPNVNQTQIPQQPYVQPQQNLQHIQPIQQNQPQKNIQPVQQVQQNLQQPQTIQQIPKQQYPTQQAFQQMKQGVPYQQAYQNQQYQNQMQPKQQVQQVQQQNQQFQQPLRPGMRPVMPPGRKPPNPRRLIYGIISFFGCSIFLFIIFVFLFVSQTSSTGENALAKSLGLDTGSFINTLITLVNIVFGFFAIILFLVAVVGLFKVAMARRDDKEAKKKGAKLAGVTGALLIFTVFIWVGTYLYLSSKKVVSIQNTVKAGIITDPAVTLGLTAPILVKFDGTRLPIEGRKEILAFLWDFGDGESSTVQSPSHIYKDKGKNNGRFDVKATVSLKDRTTNEETTQVFPAIVTISNVKLNPDFTASPSNGPAPLTVQFDASSSSAPAGEIQSYDWDFKNNNTFNDGKGVKISHTFDQVGIYTVNMRITDNTGQFGVISHDITVEGPNTATAKIDIPTTDGHYFAGTQYTFKAENSASPNGKITKYEWDFGDQSPKASTRTVTHVYKNPGDYEITLNVTDEKNTIGQTTQKIRVEAAVGAALASITTVPGPAKTNDGYISGTLPFEVRFDASKSTQTNGSIVDYKWDFDGDGSDDAAGKQVTYVYKDQGTYNATLTVIDAQNKQSTALLVVKVLPQGLQARLTADPVQGVRPMTVTFDASGSSYPTGQIGSYEWDFGDGTAKRIDVSKVTYQYTQIGTFTAKVVAIATDGTRSNASLSINVRPVPLKSCFSATTEQGAAPLTVEFDPHCSTGTVAKYSWNFGDGETSKTRKPTHTFAKPGSYEVQLEVIDNQNVIDGYSLNILVTGTVQ